MLEELKNLNYHGGKDGLLFFLCDVIGRTGVSIRDAEVICSHAPGKRQLSVEDLVSYCLALGWIKKEADDLVAICNEKFEKYSKAYEALTGRKDLSLITW